MPEYTDNRVSEVNPQGLRGPLWTIAGTAIGGLATQLLGGNCGGGLFNAFGGGCQGSQGVTTHDTRLLAEKDARIAELEGQRYTDSKVQELYSHIYGENKELNLFLTGLDKRVASIETAAPLRAQIVDQQIARVTDQVACCCNATNAAIANLQATVANITKTVVPNTSVCPGWGNVTITPAASTTTTVGA
jgi:hypothetical protein